MNTLDMMKALKDGKKVRNKNWENQKDFMFLDEKGRIVTNFTEPLAGLEHYIYIRHMYEDNWEIFHNLVPFRELSEKTIFVFDKEKYIKISVSNCVNAICLDGKTPRFIGALFLDELVEVEE